MGRESRASPIGYTRLMLIGDEAGVIRHRNNQTTALTRRRDPGNSGGRRNRRTAYALEIEITGITLSW